MRCAMASTEPSICESVAPPSAVLSAAPRATASPRTRVRGASLPGRTVEPIASSGGGDGGIAATMDISTASARALAAAFAGTAPAAPDLLTAMYAAADEDGATRGADGAASLGATLLMRPGPTASISPGAASFTGVATKIDCQADVPELAVPRAAGSRAPVPVARDHHRGAPA